MERDEATTKHKADIEIDADLPSPMQLPDFTDALQKAFAAAAVEAVTGKSSKGDPETEFPVRIRAADFPQRGPAIGVDYPRRKRAEQHPKYILYHRFAARARIRQSMLFLFDRLI